MQQALLFSGQGSQYVGMMKDLADAFAPASDLIRQADSLLGFPLSTICFEGPAETLKETRYTQPALFVHEAVLLHLLGDALPYGAVAGHSLGEYSALYAADVLDFESALRLVKLRGELMFRAGTEQPGTMFAVLGLDDEQVREVCRRLNTDEKSVIVAANFNAPGQVVVSGSADYLRGNADAFRQAGARRVVELPVSGAFHSPLMQSAQGTLAAAIRETQFNDARVAVYCNCEARALQRADDIREALIQQLVAPVLWTQTLQAMHSAGIRSFVEIGPGKVLQGLTKRILGAEAESSGFDTAGDLQEQNILAS